MMDVDVFFEDVLEAIANRSAAACPRRKSPEWSQDEIDFIHAHHADMLDNEIAEALGRSEMAVKIYRTRQCLPAASRARTDWVASHRAARLLGVSSHAMTWWCEHGLIPYTMGGPNRQLRLVRVRDLTKFAVNPINWPYFDWRKITDPRLRRLCELRAMRWGDEWWATRQVAEYHGVDVKDVTRLIKAKRITAFCPPISRGGRHEIRKWAYWFVLKSEATRSDLVFYRRKGAPGEPRGRTFTPAADTWILRGRDVYGFSWARIARSMGGKRRKAPNSWTVKMRYDHLCNIGGHYEREVDEIRCERPATLG